jgi:hypothetical protein
MNMKKTILFSLFSFALGISAQTYKEDVLRAYKTLRNAASYSLCMEYRMYLDGNMNQVYESRTAEIRRQRGNLFIKQNNGLEVLSNSKYRIYLDNRGKSMTVSKKRSLPDSAKRLDRIDRQFEESIDTTLAAIEKLKLVSETATLRTYECIFKPNPSLIKATITINKKTGIFERVLKEFKKPVIVNNEKHSSTLEIRYTHFSPGVAFGNEVFNSSAYITAGKDGKLIPASRYSKYEFKLSK